MNYNKKDLIEKISEKYTITKAEASRCIDSTMGGIKEILKGMKPGDKIQLVGNLSLEVVHSKEREGHCPRNPEEKLVIPAKNKIKVKAGKEMQELIAQD